MRVGSALKRALSVAAWDCAGICGCGLIVYGTWLVFQPAGYIVGGVMLVAATWLRAGRD